MLLSSISLALTRLCQRLGRWSPLALWPDGISSAGMWISPRTLDSQWQDYTGTTPVATPGTVADSSNPVGLAYDLRAETVTASPSTADLSGATWVRNAATTLGNQITFTGLYGNIGNIDFFPANTAAVSIGRIVLTLDIEHVSGNTNLSTVFRDLAAPGGNAIYPLILTSGQRTTLTQIHVFIGDVPPVSPEILIVQDRNASNFAVVKLHSVTYAYTPGNHMLQSTSAARPLLSARVNLLTKTEDFSDAVWVALGATASANTATAPDGTTTANTMSDGTNDSRHTLYINNFLVISGVVMTFSLYVKYVDRRYFVLGFDAIGIARVFFDLVDGVITQEVASVGAIESVGGGWYRVSITITTTSVSSYPQFSTSDRASSSPPLEFGTPVYTGENKTVLIWGAQLNLGSTALPYQRVNTDSDYDATGFPIAQKYDGVDDSLASATFAAGTLTSSMDCLIAVRRDSAAATYLISDTGSRGFFEWESGDTNRPDVSAGTPTYYVDGVAVTATKGALFTALTAGDWHILEARGLDLSTWTALEVSSLVSYRLNGARGDILLYPSTASTEDKDAARQWLADYYGVTLS